MRGGDGKREMVMAGGMDNMMMIDEVWRLCVRRGDVGMDRMMKD